MHVRASTIQNKNEVGWGSEIEGIIGDKPRKIRGDRTDILLYEESGSWPNWEKAFIQGDALVGVTGNRFGIKFAWGTGGDSGPALQGLAKAFYNPQLFDVMPFKSKYNNKGEDAITAYFIPAYTMVNLPGITDSRGYCDPELGKKYYEKDRAAKVGDPAVLLIFSAEYCFTPEEALALEGDNKFNTELLSEQLARINIHKELPPDGAIQSGHLDYTFRGERKDENITGFHWIPSPTGKIKILEHPKTDSEGNVFRNLYIAGIDGIDLGQSETSESTRDPSDFAIVIKRRSFGMQPPTIVCIYKDRPANIKDAHITAVKLLRYYNCQALIEKSKISFITYCRDKGLANKLLLRTPRSCLSDILNGRSTAFGAPATVPIIEHQLDLIAEYIEEYYYCLWFPELIEELIKYSFEAKRKFDLVAAFGMCELADEEMAGIVVRQEESSINKIRKFGYYYDEDGIKRYGQIPDTNKFETRVNLNKRNDNARIRTSDPRRYG